MSFCQVPMIQCPMVSNLPAAPNAVVLDVIAVAIVVDVQAALDARGEAPNTQLPLSIIFLLTPCIGVKAIRIETDP